MVVVIERSISDNLLNSFHPVTRSAEVILSSILKRAKHLYLNDYQFKQKPVHFYSFFTERPSLSDYLQLDEAITMYYFHMWQQEDDLILRDLCDRFINRRLFKYVEFNPNLQMTEWPKLHQLFHEAHIDPDYYLVIDSSSDLPYDFYRPGEEEERLPIHLLMPNGKLRELSRESDVVEAITGKKRTDHKLYFPLDFLEDDKTHQKEKREILHMLFKK